MTAQIPDWLHHQGQRCPLFDNPLESFFDDDHPRPDFKMPSTACWRGYTAEWEIEDDTLYLVGLDGWVGDEDDTYARNAQPVRLEDVFPWVAATYVPRGVMNHVGLEDIFPWATDRIKATWFTGVLRVPRGEQLEYVHMGYGSTYEEDLLLTLEGGRLVHTEVRDNREFFAEEAWLDQVKANCTEILSDLLPWQWLHHLPWCVGRDIIIGVRGIVVAVFVLILPFLLPYVIYKRGWNPRKWNLLWVNALLEADVEGRPTWWKELPASEKIFAIILGPIFIVMVPFMVSYLIYKRGWNPKKWGLFWRPRRLVRKPGTPAGPASSSGR